MCSVKHTLTLPIILIKFNPQSDNHTYTQTDTQKYYINTTSCCPRFSFNYLAVMISLTSAFFLLKYFFLTRFPLHHFDSCQYRTWPFFNKSKVFWEFYKDCPAPRGVAKCFLKKGKIIPKKKAFFCTSEIWKKK